MARPREFDEDQVLDAATQVFWERGYGGASIQDLVDATGLGRASLYGAFGDKQAIFGRVLARYQERVGQELAAAAAGRSPLEALEALAIRWVEMSSPRSGPRGCMLVLAGTSCSAEDAWVQEALTKASRSNEATFERMFRLAQSQGEIAADRDPAALARLFLVLMQGVATSARAGILSRERLQEAVATALQDWKAGPAAKPKRTRRAERAR
jgi:AcrR family transcriptional regulator